MRRSLLALVFVSAVVPSFALAGSCPTLPRSLSVGTRGSDVTQLQMYLGEAGFLNVASTGYFGQLTKAAVQSFQKAHSVLATGTVGPLTRAAISATCVMSPPPAHTESQPESQQLPQFVPQINTLSASPEIGTATLSVTFTYADATKERTYKIDYGDGASGFLNYGSSAYSASHTYASPGTYIANVSLCSYANMQAIGAQMVCVAPMGDRANSRKTIIVSSATAAVVGATIDQSSLLNSSSTPTITGTATGAASVTVKITGNGVNLVQVATVMNGRWSATFSPALSAASYSISVYDSANFLLASATLTLSNYATRAISGSPNTYEILGVGDFNKDGKPDIMFKTAQNNLGYVQISGDVASWQAITNSNNSYIFIGIGDFNKDGISDVMFKDANGNAGYFEIKTDNSATWHSLGVSISSYSVVGVGDFDRDGFADLMVRDNSGALGYFQVHSGNTTKWQPLGGSTYGLAIAGIGDVNKDGILDIVLRDQNGNLSYYQINSDNTIKWHAIGGSSVDYSIVGVADFNKDGYVDLMMRSSSGDMGYYQINGLNDTSVWRSVGGTSVDATVVGIADLSGDGIPDVVFRNSSGNFSYYQISMLGSVLGATIACPLTGPLFDACRG